MDTKVITKADLNDKNEYIEDSLIFDGHIQIEANLGYVSFRLALKATGSIIAFSGSGIKAGSGIEAGWGIKAGEGIEAGSGIEAGLSISCKYISSKLRIFAGLCIWKMPSTEEKQIQCEQLREGEIAYGELVIKEKVK